MHVRLDSERQLTYLVDLAEGRIPKNKLYYRIRSDVDTDHTIDNTQAYPECLLDPVAAARMLLRHYYQDKQDNRQPHPVLDDYVTRCIGKTLVGVAADVAFNLKK
jgi:hypothetical protein